MTEEEKKTKDFYERLRDELEQDTSWPAPYLYKFIVPASMEKISEIQGVFNDMDAVLVQLLFSGLVWKSISAGMSPAGRSSAWLVSNHLAGKNNRPSKNAWPRRLA